MKKLLAVLLLLTVLVCGSSCKRISSVSVGKPNVYEIAESSKPTKVTTEVNYVTNAGDKLNGYYVTTIDGNDTVFEYTYDRLATPAESIEDGSNSRIKTVEGVIYYHDGVYSGDQEEWKPGTGTAFDLKLNIKKSNLKDISFNDDKTILTAKVSPDKAPEVLGTNLNATGDISLVVETNGVNLTMVTISCTTANGTMTIRTSYTYNVQDLFPEEA